MISADHSTITLLMITTSGVKFAHSLAFQGVVKPGTGQQGALATHQERWPWSDSAWATSQLGRLSDLGTQIYSQ